MLPHTYGNGLFVTVRWKGTILTSSVQVKSPTWINIPNDVIYWFLLIFCNLNIHCFLDPFLSNFKLFIEYCSQDRWFQHTIWERCGISRDSQPIRTGPSIVPSDVFCTNEGWQNFFLESDSCFSKWLSISEVTIILSIMLLTCQV
jgi:hypothetical protein